MEKPIFLLIDGVADKAKHVIRLDVIINILPKFESKTKSAVYIENPGGKTEILFSRETPEEIHLKIQML